MTIQLKISILFFLLTGILFQACSSAEGKKEIILELPYSAYCNNDLNNGQWYEDLPQVPVLIKSPGKSFQDSDLSAWFKSSWCPDGIRIYCEMTDDRYAIDTVNPWKSDALEIMLAPSRGSTDIVQFTVIPSDNETPEPSWFIIMDYRTTPEMRKIPAEIIANSGREGNTTYYEVFIPLNIFNVRLQLYSSLAMQLSVNDADEEGKGIKNQLRWYPSGSGFENSFAMFTLICNSEKTRFPEYVSSCYIIDNKKIEIIIYSINLYKQNWLKITNQDKIVYSGRVREFPFTLNLDIRDMNVDYDTLQVCIGKKIVSVHELLNVPRIYRETRPLIPFESQIRFFEAVDRLSFPPENGTLFIGSSSIRRWYSIRDYFPDCNIIHRGFGGSNAADVLRVMDKIVLPYKPSSIVYYEGDNDIAQGIPVEKICADIDSFIIRVNRVLPGSEIFIISPKPSYARMYYRNKYLELNRKIISLCGKYEFTHFINVVDPVFDESGKLRRDIFVEDSLHLNEEGYKIWGKIIGNEILKK
jgi:lysophospholipase L1-like esterase